MNFVSSKQRDDEDEGDSDSDKEVSEMFSLFRVSPWSFLSGP